MYGGEGAWVYRVSAFPQDTFNFVHMKAARSNSQLFADGQQFEKAGKWEDAAAAYQRVVNNDPENQDAVARLLVAYRKLKDYSRELAVIDAAIGAVAERDKATQREWISAHPEAARLGRAVLKQLGGERVTAYGTDPFVERLMKRRALVERKAGGGGKKKEKAPAAGKEMTGKRRRGPEVQEVKSGKRKKVTEVRKAIAGKEAAEKKKEQEARRKEAATKRAEAKRKRKEAAERKAAEKKRAGAAAPKAAAEMKKKEIEARKAAKEAEAEKRRAEKEAKAHPSLFIVSLRYLVPLERIDAAMDSHVAFLDRHFAQREFLAAGRLVPRTGGIILVRAKNRVAVEKIMKQDPFLKRKLASVDIVEFVASKMDKGLRKVI